MSFSHTLSKSVTGGGYSRPNIVDHEDRRQCA